MKDREYAYIFVKFDPNYHPGSEWYVWAANKPWDGDKDRWYKLKIPIPHELLHDVIEPQAVTAMGGADEISRD